MDLNEARKAMMDLPAIHQETVINWARSERYRLRTMLEKPQDETSTDILRGNLVMLRSLIGMLEQSKRTVAPEFERAQTPGSDY